MDQENVSATLTVAAAAARVFAVLADPATYLSSSPCHLAGLAAPASQA